MSARLWVLLEARGTCSSVRPPQTLLLKLPLCNRGLYSLWGRQEVREGGVDEKETGVEETGRRKKLEEEEEEEDRDPLQPKSLAKS